MPDTEMGLYEQGKATGHKDAITAVREIVRLYQDHTAEMILRDLDKLEAEGG